jgi:hypothetical protein
MRHASFYNIFIAITNSLSQRRRAFAIWGRFVLGFLENGAFTGRKGAENEPVSPA